MLVLLLLFLLLTFPVSLFFAGVVAIRSPRHFALLAAFALLLGTLCAFATFRVRSLGPVHVKQLHPELTGYWDSAYIRATGFPSVQWATDEPAYIPNDVRSAYFWGGVRWNALFYSVPSFLLLAFVRWVILRARTSPEDAAA